MGSAIPTMTWMEALGADVDLSRVESIQVIEARVPVQKRVRDRLLWLIPYWTYVEELVPDYSLTVVMASGYRLGYGYGQDRERCFDAR